MKTTTNIIYSAVALFALTCFALAPATDAQCPQICDSNDNTAVGNSALISNTTGTDNIAIGVDALFSNTTAVDNTAIGFQALYSNVGTGPLAGSNNTAVGFQALYSNTTSSYNTGIGSNALALTTTGCCNTATGFQTLYSNTTGYSNSAYGFTALNVNTTGFNNTATGRDALFANTTGSQNTADGFEALRENNMGKNNTAAGAFALVNNTGNNNAAIGVSALAGNTTGVSNIALGYKAGGSLTTGSNNIDIFDKGVAGESNTIRIGTVGTQTNAYIAGISGATVPTGVAVIVDSSGHLGTTTSSARFKEGIKPMDKASEAILALRPVTFRYKKDLDPDGIPQFGLVAEEVEKVNPALVARDEQGKPYTVRYDAVNAMLLNEFLKEHREVQEQKATIAKLNQDFQSRLAEQQKQIQQLTAGLQKVSAQLELGRPALQSVVDNH